jgi:3-oxoacyl-[acyl-carrier-protein] synthase-1
VDRCGASIKASYFPEIVYVQPEERFRQLTRQVLDELLERQPELKILASSRIWVLLPSLSRSGMTPSVISAVEETIREISGKIPATFRYYMVGQLSWRQCWKPLSPIKDKKTGSIFFFAVDSWLPAPS